MFKIREILCPQKFYNKLILDDKLLLVNKKSIVNGESRLKQKTACLIVNIALFLIKLKPTT